MLNPFFSYIINCFILVDSQDEVRNPRQVLTRMTWDADRGVRCHRTQWSGKYLGRAFRLTNGNFSLFGLRNTHISVWPIPKFRSVRSGQCPNFGLFGLANTHISVCLVWPIPIFRSVRSGQCPYFGLFGLANTHISVCLVWPMPILLSVRSYRVLGLLKTNTVSKNELMSVHGWLFSEWVWSWQQKIRVKNGHV